MAKLVMISNTKNICVSTGDQALVSHIPGKHHTARPTRYLTTTTFPSPMRKHVLMCFRLTPLDLWKILVLFVELLISLFWTYGDACSRFLVPIFQANSLTFVLMKKQEHFTEVMPSSFSSCETLQEEHSLRTGPYMVRIWLSVRNCF